MVFMVMVATGFKFQTRNSGGDRDQLGPHFQSRPSERDSNRSLDDRSRLLVLVPNAHISFQCPDVGYCISVVFLADICRNVLQV